MGRPLVMIFSVVMVVGACGGESSSSTTELSPATTQAAPITTDAVTTAEVDPAAVIEAYEAAYNAGDIDGVMALFSEESAITNHPTDDYAAGLTDIRALHVEDMAEAATQDAYTFSNIEVDGDVVRWDYEWITSAGSVVCNSGNQATIESGIIVSWFWPAGDVDFGSQCQ